LHIGYAICWSGLAFGGSALLDGGGGGGGGGGFGRGAGPGGGPGGFGMLAINISSFEDRSSRDVRRLQSALMWLSSVD
jgi:hypothetical protein